MAKTIRYFFKLGFILVFAWGLGVQSTLAQSKSLVEKPQNKEIPKSFDGKIHSPRKATLLSLVPGLGQAYNRKYWKIPIIYAGFGTLGYFLVQNNTEYNKFRVAFNYKSSNSTGPIPNNLVNQLSLDQLQEGRDYYRRNFEFTVILTSLWYILNLVDATVDAHLFNYNVNDDLSLGLDPIFQANPSSIINGPQTGLKLTLKF